jgi:DNA-directed RNA polymerase specialized sigma24 family protein
VICGCGADLSSVAVALARTHAACCRSEAFRRLDAECRELAQSVPGLPPGEREAVISDLLFHLLRIPQTGPSNARAYLRRALCNAWCDRLRSQGRDPSPIDPNGLEGATSSEGPSPDEEEGVPTPDEVAEALEAHLPAAALGKRGQTAREKFARVMQGLIDQHLRGRRTRAELLAAEGWKDSDVNRLEKAQERARADLIGHLLDAAAVHPDPREVDRLDRLVLAVETLREAGAEQAVRRRAADA